MGGYNIGGAVEAGATPFSNAVGMGCESVAGFRLISELAGKLGNSRTLEKLKTAGNYTELVNAFI